MATGWLRVFPATFDRLIRATESRPFSPYQIFFTAAWVAGFRFLEEKAFIYDATTKTPHGSLGIIVAWWVFYAALGVCIAAIITRLARVEWRRALQITSLGLTLAVLPPLIDIWIYGRGNFVYRYQKDFFADTTFLLFNPSAGLPIGEALTVWLSILLAGAYVFHKTQTWWRAILAGALQYGLGVFFGVLLPVIVKGVYQLPGTTRFGEKWVMAWAGLVVLLVAYFILRPHLFREGLWRLPQVLLAPALVFLGAAYIDRVNVLTALAAIAFAGVSTVFAVSNLYYDRKEDAAGGHVTGVTHDDVIFLSGWSVLALVTLLRHHTLLALCVGLFLVTAWAYHADPLRTKCVFPLSYKSEGFFALTAFLAGIVGQHTYRMEVADVVVAALIFGGISLSAPFKDAKDVEGDRQARVATLYVVLAKRGCAFAQVHRLAGILLLACLAVPVVWLGWRGAPVEWTAAVAASAVVTVAMTRLPNRKLGVALAVFGVVAYVTLLGVAILP